MITHELKNLIKNICSISGKRNSLSISDNIIKAIDNEIDMDTLCLYLSYYEKDPKKTEVYLSAYNEELSLENYNPDLYTGEQLNQILSGKRYGIDISVYHDHRIPEDAMESIRIHLINIKNEVNGGKV